MPKRLRATLRGLFWTRYFASIRYCYSCGKKLERRYVPEEKRRRHICLACRTITYLNPKVVAGLIPVMPDGRVVLLRRKIEPSLGKWTYPSGFQELGESVDAAAEREAWEEIRAHVRIRAPVGIYSYPDAGVVTVVYEGLVREHEKPRAGEEAEEIVLFKPDRLPWRDLAFRSTVEALRDWKRKTR